MVSVLVLIVLEQILLLSRLPNLPFESHPICELLQLILGFSLSVMPFGVGHSVVLIV